MKKVNDGPNSRAGIGHDRPASVRLHPFVYKSICVLAIVFLFSAAWGFAGDDYTGYLIAVVAGLFFVALALPFTLWRIGRSHRIRSKPGADARIPGMARSREGLQCRGRGAFADRRGRLRHGRIRHRLAFHLTVPAI